MNYSPLRSSATAAQSAQIIDLSANQASVYEALTYPHFAPLLHSLAENANVVAVGAEVEGVPVGLAIACLNRPDDAMPRQGQVLSLFVTPDHRNRGLGRLLLTHLETELGDRGCQQLEIRYLSSPQSPALERILVQQQWFAPQATALVCYASTDRVRQAPPPHLVDYLGRWLDRLPAHYQFFLWTELTPAERTDLEQRMQGDGLMQRFNPFLDADRLEPLNSLGLHCDNRIIGWVITYRIAADTIRYTQMYVDPASQPLSRSTLLLAKAIQLQVEQLPHTKGTFRVDIDNTPMVRFVHRRLKPYLDEVRTAYCAIKILQ
ncbi:GNAT family N-acetyltransferase [Leptolyngbya sp. CCNP1308]|uniref:GNAT family N-acetyltransferase n=1 Tax=Leptolyngbya sp. CCNP1308 TaxID=3110255 RepID=UPI002B2021E7|nr:GNAT family N-acetyltransferase [Leptolyngbya sp. CCNP1308]MEA5448212.1 GNAT family N-acetyltransferase [Leptolyngbya sp. CCNP1308]